MRKVLAMNQTLFFMLVFMPIFLLLTCQAVPVLAALKVHCNEQIPSDVKLAKDNKVGGWRATMIKDGAAGQHNIKAAETLLKAQRKMDIGKKWKSSDMESRVLMVYQLDYAAAKTHPPTEP
eukprot:c17925_g1_i1 orf=466-828(-)